MANISKFIRATQARLVSFFQGGVRGIAFLISLPIIYSLLYALFTAGALPAFSFSAIFLAPLIAISGLITSFIVIIIAQLLLTIGGMNVSFGKFVIASYALLAAVAFLAAKSVIALPW